MQRPTFSPPQLPRAQEEGGFGHVSADDLRPLHLVSRGTSVAFPTGYDRATGTVLLGPLWSGEGKPTEDAKEQAWQVYHRKLREVFGGSPGNPQGG